MNNILPLFIFQLLEIGSLIVTNLRERPNIPKFKQIMSAFIKHKIKKNYVN